MADPVLSRNAKKSAELQRILTKEAEIAQTRKINEILKIPANERSGEQQEILACAPNLVEVLEERAKNREKQRQRSIEKEDTESELRTKCKRLSREIRRSKFTVVYTGAGISTAASIPDYRGPNGVWTLLRKGETPKAVDLSDAEPTYTHMCISKLHSEGLIKHVVSQNCDGLHMRSGLPRSALSELHGNMYLELCKSCKPVSEHIRLFDVTERTGLRRHKTARSCPKCGGNLTDSIIHFGEKGPLHSPYNWRQATKAADQSKLIICLGTSLKVLRRYACLWSMHKSLADRPKLFVINLMWTPKDDLATLKINGKCDDVMKLTMEYLKIVPNAYTRLRDPIFTYALPLSQSESHTCSKKILEEPPGYNKGTICTLLSDIIAKQPPVVPDDSDQDDNSITMSDHEDDSNSSELPPEATVVLPGKADSKTDSDAVNETKSAPRGRRKMSRAKSSALPTRPMNTRKRKLTVKMAEMQGVDLNGLDDLQDEPTEANGQETKPEVNSKQRKTLTSKSLPVKNEATKRRGRPTRNSQNSKKPTENSDGNSINNKTSDENELKMKIVNEPESNIDTPSQTKTELKSVEGDDNSIVLNGQNNCSNTNTQHNNDTHTENSNGLVVNNTISESSSTELVSSAVSESANTPNRSVNKVSTSADKQVPIQQHKVVLDQSDIMDLTESTPHPKPISEPSVLNLSTHNINPQSSAEPTMKSPTIDTTKAVSQPILVSPPQGASRRKTLNNLLEKIQARQGGNAVNVESHSNPQPSSALTTAPPRCSIDTSVGKSPRKIKDYYISEASTGVSSRKNHSGLTSDAFSPSSRLVSGEVNQVASEPTGSSEQSKQIICVKGCDGYEPGEVHYHSADHASSCKAAPMDNWLLGIPNLNIQQVWAATYSACFMASYQALQNRVLQQHAQHNPTGSPLNGMPPQLPLITQTDLVSLAADTGFQSQLLAQFQQNLLRSMAGVVSQDKQAYVLAQTQQVLMQNIAAMDKAKNVGVNKGHDLTNKPGSQTQSHANTSFAGSTVFPTQSKQSISNQNVVSQTSTGISKASQTPLLPSEPRNVTINSTVTGNLVSSAVAAISCTSPPSYQPYNRQHSLASPTSSNSSCDTSLNTSFNAGNATGVLIGSPSTSPIAGGSSGSTSPRLGGLRQARGVCGPRVKHKKKWWQIQPSDEVNDVVNKHLENIRKAAQDRSMVRQEIERRTQSLPEDIARHTPQRCKRRSGGEARSSTNATPSATSEESSGHSSAAPQFIKQREQREAALRSLIATQSKSQTTTPTTPEVTSIDTNTHIAVTTTASALGVDPTRLTSAEKALMGAMDDPGVLVPNPGSNPVLGHVITIEPEAPSEDEAAEDNFSMETDQYGENDVIEVGAGYLEEGDSFDMQSNSVDESKDGAQKNSAAMVPGWFGKGWRVNKKQNKRKKAR